MAAAAFGRSVGFEPPPNIMTPGKIRGKIRTGAKTATVAQQYDPPVVGG